ncbi:Glyoxalase-like domain protein [Chryseobacterium sp. MOF25P]|uniref:VOC family protein n=1 Tax=unclassified Chryseobacterium TaxID=2593645 RepID=UPI000804A464|nr:MULTISPECIES: VOC family protein [unclassified Chryseobacterium]OBW41758.1 Glyoxalase-like domain protein [Chryseobacterium sp. MOF25P]OBW46870.1 Glyoxalase-like domain protein [Chryseobacterium sp. BGARF1]
MEINQIYVNLPVTDVQKTREFWTKLGFSINEQFSDEKAICVIMKQDHIYTMFLKEEFFQTFTDRPVAKGDTTQTLLAIGVNSREEVDEMVKTATENGGSKYSEPIDYGWMYQKTFSDLDGHQWEILFSDMSQLPAEF